MHDPLLHASLSNETFCRALPKVELHAHLTGSISRQALHDLWLRKRDAGIRPEHGSNAVPDPMIAIPSSADGVNISTFFPIFNDIIYKLITTAEDVRTTTFSVLSSFADDGVAHLELRTTPRATAGLSKEAYVTLVLEVIASHNASQSALRSFLILSVDRRQTAAEAEETVRLAQRYRERGVVGVDLCGNPLQGDVRVFAPAFKRAREAGLGITVHFGEVPQSGTREELMELLAWEPARLGHVIHMPEDVRLEVERRGLGLELCLSCNVLAAMTAGGFKEHHFGVWTRSHCPIALSTDDVGIFESELSNEYALAMEHFGLKRDDLVALSRQASTVMFAGEEEAARLSMILDNFESANDFDKIVA